MNRKKICYLLLCLLLGISASAFAMPYAYVSQYEVTPLGELATWSAADSIFGDVFTSDSACYWVYAPYIDGTVYMTGHNGACGDTSAVVGTSARVTLPDEAYLLRTAAAAQGHCFTNQSHTQYVAHLRGTMLHLYYSGEGVPFDSLQWHRTTVPGSGVTRIFVQGDLRISGVFSGDWGIGSSGDISIDDDIVAQGTNLENGELPENCRDYLTLFAERSIIIRNTWANGRENSAQGSDVVITAALVALGCGGSLYNDGGLMMDQPNNSWDTYICPCAPDLRGTIRLTGALIQRYHLPWRNNNNGGTGYNLVLKYDERLRYRGIMYDPWMFTDLPDTMNFGEVAVGEVARDTISISSSNPLHYSGALTSHPFSAPSGYQYTSNLTIPVSFSPLRPGIYSGFVSFFLNGEYQEITLKGSAVTPPGTQTFTTTAYPNPFNAVTTLSLTLPESGELKITLFDLLGRQVEQLAFGNLPAGQRTLHLDMSNYASGVYFARLQSGRYTITHKLMLMK